MDGEPSRPSSFIRRIRTSSPRNDERPQNSLMSRSPVSKKWKYSNGDDSEVDKQVAIMNRHQQNHNDNSNSNSFRDFKLQIQNLANNMDYMNEVTALETAEELVEEFAYCLKRKTATNCQNRLRSSQVHPLEIGLVLETIMKYGSCNDLLSWRQVSKLWNCMASEQLLKSKWISLKNSPILDYPFYKNNSITEFMNDVPTDSLLFPLRKFSLRLHPVPIQHLWQQESKEDMVMDSTFVKTYFNFITNLKIHYVFVEHFEESIPFKDVDNSMAFLLPKYLPNLESLSLHVYPRQLFVQRKISDDTSVPSIYSKFKSLEIEILSIGTREVEDRVFSENNFFCQLLKSCPSMESFELTANRGRITIMQQAMDLFYSLKMKNLTSLSFNSSTRGSRIDLGSRRYSGLPSPYRLKSFTLRNIVAFSLHEFLQQHKTTLLDLKIKYGIILHTSDSDEFDQILQSMPTLGKVRTLELNYYPRSETCLGHLLTKAYFPNMNQLRFKIINVSNWRCNIDDINESKTIHEQIQDLEIDFTDGLLTGKSTFLQQFSKLKCLKLFCVSGTFLNLLNSKAMSQTITQLSLQVQDKNSNSPWDSILTGVSPADIHQVLHHIRHQFQQHHDNFDLKKYDFTNSIGLCKEGQGISIAYMQNLQKFEIRSTGMERLRITEITLVFLLKGFPGLTSIHIQNCCIPKTFAKKIQLSIPPSFVVKVKGL